MTEDHLPEQIQAANTSINGDALLQQSPDNRRQDVISEIQELRQDFDTKLKYDEGKQKIIDTLHKELEDHRTGLHFKILRPVLLDLIHLYDDIEKIMADAATKTEVKQVQNDLHLLRGEIEEILQRNGVEAFRLEGPFQSSKQRAVQIYDTEEKSYDKNIVKSLRKGFSYEDRILRTEQVIVYKFVGR